MTMAFPRTLPPWRDGLQSRLVYGALLPLFLLSEGLGRLSGRLLSDEGETAPSSDPWLEHARSQAAIATSYALTARRLLQSSERRRRPERPS